MKKPRKKYTPKPIRVDTMHYVKSGLLKVADVPVAGAKLSIQNHVSFDEIREGRGDTDHVDVLIKMVNIAEALAKLQLGRDWLPEIEQAQQALHDLGQRGVSGKNFIFKGEELSIVQTILELHDEQLRNCPVKKMEEAIDMVDNEEKHGRMRRITRLEYA
jgi:hypothetical protein